MDARPRSWPVWRLIGVCAVALTTANCAGNNPQRMAGAASSGSEIDPKYGVKASRRLYNEGDVIPKGGGRRFSGKPYVVAGKTYVPRDDAKGYVREGLASWYGSAFHGRMTANGEVFDRHSIAAAHPTLPLPSYARVTNLSNGYSMVVRVNDRGPYHANRVMDLSEEAARALDFHNKGTEKVRVEYVGKASVAGSDDRRLLASLRTDGRPASTGSGSPVMVADLGPDREQPAPERFARTTRPTLAYKPAESDEDTAEAAPAPRPQRAPIILASAASVAVPAAVQPTAARGAAFRPMPVAGLNPSGPASRTAMASAGRNAAPLSLAPPQIRLAGAMRGTAPAASARTAQAAFGGGAQRTALVSAAKASPVMGKAAPAVRTAATMPSNDKLAMARLLSASTAKASPAGKSAAVTKSASGPAGRRSHVAGVY
ncbi:septal ring lytic transglycosylase RlpA family protein [Methylobacterium thuringiense]|nr:septal ring lytic transglycosylase RlpA family protein [Methylobacterium thuringiense]